MHKKTFFVGIIFLMLLSSVFAGCAVAQTGSLAVWENIADGVLTSDWTEVEADNWTGQNVSGVWEYNCTTDTVAWSYNDTINGSRWYMTFDVTSENVTDGIGALQMGLNGFYGVIYYLDGPVGATPEAYIVYYNTTDMFYWNGTGFETNISNATEYAVQEWEEDYTSGNFIRFKTIWNWNQDNGSSNCTVRLKIWDPDSDEPPVWMIDDAFVFYTGEEESLYYPGLFVDHNVSGLGETDFSHIMFWNLSWDLYGSTGIPEIVCPTLSADDFFTTYVNYYNSSDMWNSTQLLKAFVNLWDLTSFYTDDQYDGVTDQNDTVYHFSLMVTDIRDWIDNYFDESPPWAEDFPDNMLFMRSYITTDGSNSEDDYMLLRIDTDNNGKYDDYDMAFWTNDTTTLVYHGDTSYGDDSIDYAYMYSGSGDPISEVFRDNLYYCYTTLINWDLVYNGTSGERVGTDVCRMSLSWENDNQSNLSVLQDFNVSYDTVMIEPASEIGGWDVNDSTDYWLFFYIDESISGDEMADPEDPVPYTPPSTGEQTNFITSTVVPILVASVVLVTISGLIFSSGFTKETIMAVMMAAIIGVIVISIVSGL